MTTLPQNRQMVYGNVLKIWEKYSRKIYYSLYITDSAGTVIDSRRQGHSFILNPFFTVENIKLTNNNPQYIVLKTISPYPIVFGKMLLLLIGSALLAVFIMFCIFKQINLIIRQNIVSELRKDFTHSMIHNMKTPITTVIAGLSNMNSEKIFNDAKKREYNIAVMKVECDRMLALTNRILRIAEMDEGKMTLNKTRFDLREMLLKLTENLPNTAEASIKTNDVTTVYADHEMLYESFSNIVENAVKYSKPNKNTKIRISCKNVGQFVQISFRTEDTRRQPKRTGKAQKHNASNLGE